MVLYFFSVLLDGFLKSFFGVLGKLLNKVENAWLIAPIGASSPRLLGFQICCNYRRGYCG